MSIPSKTSTFMPLQVKNSLIKVGKDLKIARERRKESLRDWAGRLETSVPTLVRMESGDPKVGVSVYATAIWLTGMLENFTMVADPEKDKHALELDIQRTSSYRKINKFLS